MNDTLSKKEKIITAVVLALTFIIGCIPLFGRGISYGHDLGFHIQRLISISEGFGRGEFPVRIYKEIYNGYGYGSPLFYCDFFLYIPAALHYFFKLSLTTVWKILLVFINAATVISSKYSFDRILNKRAGTAAAVLYSLATYKLVDMYTRAALGETLALIFVPLVLCGLEMISSGETKKWYVLTIGFTGLLFSHVLTFSMMAVVSVVYCLASIRNIWKKEIILSYVTAIAFTVLCAAWYLLPFLSTITFDFKAENPFPYFHLTTSGLSDYFDFTLMGAASIDSFKGVHEVDYTLTKTPGVLLLLGSIVTAVLLVIRKKSIEHPKKITAFLISGILLIFVTSDLFPWTYLVERNFLDCRFTVFQFVWRLNVLIVLFFSITAAAGIDSLAKTPKAGNIALITVTVLSVLASLMFFKTYLYKSPRQADGEIRCYMDSLYLFKESTMENRRIFESNSPDFSIINYHIGQGTAVLECSVGQEAHQDEIYVDFPVNYYPGYYAKANNVPADTTYCDGGVVRVILPEGFTSGTVKVYYKEPAAYSAANIVSLVSFAALAGYIIVTKKKKTAEA